MAYVVASQGLEMRHRRSLSSSGHRCPELLRRRTERTSRVDEGTRCKQSTTLTRKPLPVLRRPELALSLSSRPRHDYILTVNDGSHRARLRQIPLPRQIHILQRCRSSRRETNAHPRTSPNPRREARTTSKRQRVRLPLIPSFVRGMETEHANRIEELVCHLRRSTSSTLNNLLPTFLLIRSLMALSEDRRSNNGCPSSLALRQRRPSVDLFLRRRSRGCLSLRSGHSRR